MKKIWNSLFGKEQELRAKMFRAILLIWAAGIALNALMFIFILKQESDVYAVPVVSVCILLFATWLSTKLRNYKPMVFGFLMLANVVILPFSFITSGGVTSGNSLWILVGIIMTELLLEGWMKYVAVISAFLVDTGVYIFCAVNPDAVTPLDSLVFAYADSGSTLLIAAVIMACIFKYQDMVYKKEQELAEQRKKEVEEISDSKSLFFANMSHEIRTPINTIIGLNEMTLREDVSDEVAENAINIQNASKILLTLINDILDLSKVESGKMEIVPAQYETASLLSDLVNIIWVRASQKGLEFKMDIAEDIPSMLYGDEVRIKQVITNILTNAVKYTEKGSVSLTVSGEQISDDTIRMKYAVEDTGIGIRKENIEELFTVFKRVDQQKTKKIEGTGLGLAISKQLVDMMGGEIKVDSIYQKGSNFTVILDQKIVNTNPIGAIQFANKKGMVNRKDYETSFEAPDAKVLVVDDNEMNLMVTKKLLRDTKVQVDLASSGRECLEKTLENNYHLILMDHMMPDMDGEETLKALRKRQEGYCQKAPVIALTANVMTNALQWYQDRGFDGYLAKPISGTLLEAAILKHLPNEVIEYKASNAEGGAVMENSPTVFHKKKKKISVCAECICDLPRELVNRFDIKLMYYYITTSEGRFIDTREIGSSELMEYMAKGNSAETAAAPQEEYEKFFADRLAESDQVILITVPTEINSKGHQNATAATKNFDNVTVFNSGHLSSGMGILVLKAAEMAEEGASVEEIVEALTNLRERVSTTFVLQTVENMYRNNRISKGVYNVSKALKFHPILKMYQNRLVVNGLLIGGNEVIARKYIKQQLRNKRNIDKRILFITYVGMSGKQLNEIKREVEKRMKFDTIICQKASATVSGNSGIGTFGLLYVKKR